ncbi:hypothetical protein J6590_036879, partial [Homalodisca vitripennis]
NLRLRDLSENLMFPTSRRPLPPELPGLACLDHQELSCSRTFRILNSPWPLAGLSLQELLGLACLDLQELSGSRKFRLLNSPWPLAGLSLQDFLGLACAGLQELSGSRTFRLLNSPRPLAGLSLQKSQSLKLLSYLPDLIFYQASTAIVYKMLITPELQNGAILYQGFDCSTIFHRECSFQFLIKSIQTQYGYSSCVVKGFDPGASFFLVRLITYTCGTIIPTIVKMRSEL